MRRFVLIVFALAACGTQNLKLEPVKVEPIHMTIDVNLHDASPTTKRADSSNTGWQK